jgi:hypothetical protein
VVAKFPPSTWRLAGKVSTERAAEYTKYMADTGFEEIETSEGNLGHQIMLGDLGNGTTEITAPHRPIASPLCHSRRSC